MKFARSGKELFPVALGSPRNNVMYGSRDGFLCAAVRVSLPTKDVSLWHKIPVFAGWKKSPESGVFQTYRSLPQKGDL